MSQQRRHLGWTMRGLILMASVIIGLGTAQFLTSVLAMNVPKQRSNTVTAVTYNPQDYLRGKPVRITIPSLQIDNQLENGVYDVASHSWNLSDHNAHHAEQSAPANLQGGNTFIYGHNSAQIFGRLPALQIGETAVLETANQIRFFYQLKTVTEVQPADVATLDYAGPPILTIQTCSGNWNERRQMFRFSLQRAEIPATVWQSAAVNTGL